MGRADNQLIANRHSCEVKGSNTMAIRSRIGKIDLMRNDAKALAQ